MAISPVNGGSNYVSQVQPQPQSPAELAAEKEKSSDSASKGTANAPVQPTVNTSGQEVGAVINVKA